MNTDMSKSLPSLNIEYRFLSNTMEYLFLKMPKIIFKVTKKIRNISKGRSDSGYILFSESSV